MRAAAFSADTRGWHEALGYCCSHQGACGQAQVTIHNSPPGSLCSPPLSGSHDPGTTSPGKHIVHLRLLQHHASLCCRRLVPHSVPLPLPGLSEPEPPNKPLLYPPLIWVGKRHPHVTYTQRQSQIQSWTPGAVRTKKRKGNPSQYCQEQGIRSPHSNWCTQHLCNTWIDNESSQNWGGGTWEQL